MPWTPNSTWVDGSGGGTPLSAARLNNLEAGAAWTYEAYTPTWTSSGTAPAIGNAAVTARFAKRGKLVHAFGHIAFGSTSTFGTGTYAFALPATSTTTVGNFNTYGWVSFFDNSSGNMGTGMVRFLTTTTMRLSYAATYLGASTEIGQTAPWTWAQDDIITWNLLYEAA